MDVADELDIYRFSLSSTDNLVWLWGVPSKKIHWFGDPSSLFDDNEQGDTTNIDYWQSLVHPADLTLMAQKNRALILGQLETAEHTYRIKNNKGKWVWHHTLGRVFKRDKQGKVLSIVFFSSFANKQKKLEKQLNLSNQRLNEAFSGTFDTVWDWNLDSDIIDVSNNWKKALGLDTEQSILLRKTWNPLIHPEDQQHARDSVVALLKGDFEFLNFEYRIRVADGDYYWILVRGHVSEKTAAGRIKRIIGVLTNIDRLKKKEEELLQRDEQIGLTMLSTGSSLVEYDLVKKKVTHRTYSLVDNQVIPQTSCNKMLSRPTTVHSKDYDIYQAFIEGFNQPSPALKEAKWRSKVFGNDYRWYQTKGHVVERDNKGRALKVVGIRQDIHDAYATGLQRDLDREREFIAYENSMHSVWEWHPLSGYVFLSEHMIEKLTFNTENTAWGGI